MDSKQKTQTSDTENHPYRVRLPGFLIEEQIGLGDVIKRATYGFGIKSCAGCRKRAEALNRWIRLVR